MDNPLNLENVSEASTDEREDTETPFQQPSLAFWRELDQMRLHANSYANEQQALLDMFGLHLRAKNARDFAGYNNFMSDYTIVGEDDNKIDLAAMCKALGEVNTARNQLDLGLEDWAKATQQAVNEKKMLDMVEEDYAKQHHTFKRKLKKHLNMKPSSGQETQGNDKDSAFFQLEQLLEMNRFDVFSSHSSFLEARKLHAVSALTSGLRAFMDFFEQGYEIMKPFKEEIKRAEEFVHGEKQRIEKDRNIWEMKRQQHETISLREMNTKMESMNAVARVRDFENVKSDSTIIEKQGYLYLRHPSVGTPVFFSLKDGTLTMTQRGQPPKTFPLLLTSVKEIHDGKSRFIIQVSSAGAAPVIVQALSYKTMNEWINVIQNAVSHELNAQHSGGGCAENEQNAQEEQSEQLKELWEIDGNDKCADCGGADPTWCSLNLGITVCLNCSGFHRNLGVHISQVRSMTLDQLDPFRLQYLKTIGNSKANKIWEATLEDNLDADQVNDRAVAKKFSETAATGNSTVSRNSITIISRPSVDAPRGVWDSFVRTKYKRKCFVPPSPMFEVNPTRSTQILMKAVEKKDPLDVMTALVWEADVNRPTDEKGGLKRTPVLAAIATGDLILTDQLLANGADLSAEDEKKWSALHIAADRNDRPMIDLIMLRGGRDLLLKLNDDGNKPADLAKKHLEGKESPATLEGPREKTRARQESFAPPPPEEEFVEEHPPPPAPPSPGAGADADADVALPPADDYQAPPPPDEALEDLAPPVPSPPPEVEEGEPPPAPQEDLYTFLSKAGTAEEARLHERLQQDLQCDLELESSSDDDDFPTPRASTRLSRVSVTSQNDHLPHWGKSSPKGAIGFGSVDEESSSPSQKSKSWTKKLKKGAKGAKAAFFGKK